MDDRREPVPAPPVGEEIHMPGPSIVPFLNAIGLTVAIVGVTFHWTVLVAGLVLFLTTLFAWVRHTARDIDELPLEHH
jgi:hypothetical protein